MRCTSICRCDLSRCSDSSRLVPTDQQLRGRNRLSGLVATDSGNAVFLTDLDGHLYRFDVPSERLEFLGSVLPLELEQQGGRIRRLYNLALSPDGAKLFIEFQRTRC